jgi:DNA-binding beta-propeller fold protein YncE
MSTPRSWAVTLAVLTVPGPVAAAESLVFESGPVRPVALTPDAALLAVTNLPDGSLELLDVDEIGLVHRCSVAVGIDPVAVAFRTATEAWVVNHVSDSISIVDVPSCSVRRTLAVGDEPRDLVFAAGRAFITTAHRGQRRLDAEISDVVGAGDPELTIAGIGRADVWVFDGEDQGPVARGRPLAIVSAFGDTPRALAVAPDGATVWVAVFNSGNGTTALHEQVVCDGFTGAAPCIVDGVEVPGGNPGPAANVDGAPAPEVGLIVRHDPSTGRWLDELQRDWAGAVPFELPDYDVFAIDAVSLTEHRAPIAGVGTTLFGMAFDPISGALYVSNTEAGNHVRFEGPGGAGHTTVRGDLARARITVIDPSTDAAPRPVHLNPHLDGYEHPASEEARALSLATPLDIVVSRDGRRLYVAAFGSARIGVFDTDALASGRVDPSSAARGYLPTTGGPAGIALDEDRGRIYVHTRFDNAIAAIDLASGETIEALELPTPEPEAVVRGRPLLYDARETSSNGEASCAACHVFADMDHLAWDLGNPDAPVTTGEIPIRMQPGSGTDVNGTGKPHDFHPMKGPMTTQTLRGLQFTGAQHWRGDRSVGELGDDPLDARVSLLNFVVAFEDLLGRAQSPTREEMESLADFVLALAMPPSPVRARDDSLTPREQAGLDFFASTTRIAEGVLVPNFGFSCAGCHILDPANGAFGTSGLQGFSNQPQIFKVPQLRNLYQRVGMFGMRAIPRIGPGAEAGRPGHRDPQIRGFGFTHDGSIDTLLRFVHSRSFDAAGDAIGFASEQERRDVVDLLLAFDSDLAPIVGQQITIDGGSQADDLEFARALIDAASVDRPSRLLGAGARAADVVAKLGGGARVRGFTFVDGAFVPDDGGSPLTPTALLALVQTGPLTLSAVVPGTGLRRGIDRDDDGVPDGVDGCPMDPTNTDAARCNDRHDRDPSGPGGASSGGSGDAETDDRSSVSPVGCGCCSANPGAPLGVLVLLARRRRRFTSGARAGPWRSATARGTLRDRV